MDDTDDEDRDGDEWGLAERGPYRDGAVWVLEDRCGTCIFRPGNLMMLEAGRVKGMVTEAVGNGSVIPCHSTLGSDLPAICRGYWDGYAEEVPVLRLAQALEMVRVEPVPVTKLHQGQESRGNDRSDR